MALDLTDNDFLVLEVLRLERFRTHFLDTLPECFLFLDRNCTLAIHCSEPWLVDDLLAQIDQLCHYAWIIVGAYQVSIWFAQEEIHTTRTHALQLSDKKKVRQPRV
jgi:hypothetical protein